jgi:hypothetical protein
MLDADELPSALTASAAFRDVAVPQFWDGGKLFGDEVARSLGASGWTAWDIYLFYPPGAEWTDAGIPAPEAALAQAGGVLVGSKGRYLRSPTSPICRRSYAGTPRSSASARTSTS